MNPGFGWGGMKVIFRARVTFFSAAKRNINYAFWGWMLLLFSATLKAC